MIGNSDDRLDYSEISKTYSWDFILLFEYLERININSISDSRMMEDLMSYSNDIMITERWQIQIIINDIFDIAN